MLLVRKILISLRMKQDKENVWVYILFLQYTCISGGSSAFSDQRKSEETK